MFVVRTKNADEVKKEFHRIEHVYGSDPAILRIMGADFYRQKLTLDRNAAMRCFKDSLNL